MTFSGIIFDMDGTLVDSEVLWEAAEAEMFRERNMDYADEVREQVIGLRLDEFFEKLIAIYDLNESVESLAEELIGRMLVLIPQQLELKAGAQEILDYAQQAGLPYCIASSSPMSIIESVVDAKGWREQIPHLFTADSVERGKPAPDVYLYAAEQLGINTSEAVAIEDSRNGAKSAVAAGMTCYVVPDFHTKADAFAEITPHVFSDLHEVLATLKAK